MCSDELNVCDHRQHTLPSWRRADPGVALTINISLLAEGGPGPLLGSNVVLTINIALLAEGAFQRCPYYKHCPPVGGRIRSTTRF